MTNELPERTLFLIDIENTANVLSCLMSMSINAYYDISYCTITNEKRLRIQNS